MQVTAGEVGWTAILVLHGGRGAMSAPGWPLAALGVCHVQHSGMLCTRTHACTDSATAGALSASSRLEGCACH